MCSRFLQYSFLHNKRTAKKSYQRSRQNGIPNNFQYSYPQINIWNNPRDSRRKQSTTHWNYVLCNCVVHKEIIKKPKQFFWWKSNTHSLSNSNWGRAQLYKALSTRLSSVHSSPMVARRSPRRHSEAGEGRLKAPSPSAIRSTVYNGERGRGRRNFAHAQFPSLFWKPPAFILVYVS